MKRIWIFLTVLVLGSYCFAAKVEIGKNNEIKLDGKLFFPIIQWAQDEKLFDENISLGVNTFSTSVNFMKNPKEYYDFCKSKGVYGISDFSESVKDHPAVLWWNHSDEPDMIDKKTGKPRISVADSIASYNKIKAKDPNHYVQTGLTGGFNDVLEEGSIGHKDRSFYKEYAKAADIFAFDVYPLYQYNKPECLWWVADSVTKLGNIMGNKGPIIPAIEACAGSKWITPAKTREPFSYEIRCQVYMSVVRGAKGIIWWTHSWIAPENVGNPKANKRWDGKKDKYYSQLGVTKENKAEMKKINAQLTRLTPVIYSPDVAGKVTTNNKDIEVLVKEYEGKTYIIAVNMKREKIDAEFSVAGLKKTAKIEVDDENRAVTSVDEGKFSDKFSEHAVHVYTITNN